MDDELDASLDAAFDALSNDEPEAALAAETVCVSLKGRACTSAPLAQLYDSTTAMWSALPDEIWVGAVRSLSAFQVSTAMQASVELRRCCCRDSIWWIQLQSRWTAEASTYGQTSWARYRQLDEEEWAKLCREPESAERDLFMEMHVAQRHTTPQHKYVCSAFKAVPVEHHMADFSDEEGGYVYEDEQPACDDFGSDAFDKGTMGRAFVYGYNCSEEQLENLH
eukprot:TRINITY_DN5495_c0_g1_i2.p1 TRINITY_DN5495_c0_g1~~TRINITY_DN5495_c0_g1_i2.p1  ORF type:complete len:223 (-),score=56.82 TRINITY_DN5495_c0_g1_i2:647-1315(-)